MKLEGKIATIIFKNDKNSWTVMLLKTKDGYITAVGETDNVDVGDELELEGEMSIHKVYGEQLKFTTYKKSLPKTDSSLIQYIADNVKGVGKKTASNIVEKFGENTVDVIRFRPAELDNIKGLNNDKISLLNDFFRNEYDKWNTIEYLTSLDLSVIVASKIYQALGKDTIDIVKQNPYSLLGFIKALDFKQVDEIGKKMGLSLDNNERVDTGIIYALNQATEFGHTCVEKTNLINYASELLAVTLIDIENGISRLKLLEKIYIQTMEDEEYVFRRSYYLAEDNIAKNIVLHTTQNIIHTDFEKQISRVSSRNSIELSTEQKEAINTSLNNSITVITGGPGTGKTTIIKCLIDILEDMNKKYVLCAPTGRAAKRITETTGKEARTLHRLLEIMKVDDDLDTFFNLEVKTIEDDVVIVDEASMIDTLMMNNLFKAIKASTQIIFVGDINQLPSVGPGNVLKDIIDSEVVNVVYLKQIYRQSAMSDIIVNAHRVNDGEYPEFKNKSTDLFYIKTSSIEDTLNEIKSLVTYRLQTFAEFDVKKDLQILTPMKKTELGTVHLNTVLQEIINPKSDKKMEKQFGDRIFREGDKVMQIVNNYDKRYNVQGEATENIEGVYNGDFGYIKKIDKEQEILTIVFDDIREIEYEFDELEQLELAYSVTIHKSQGSEFDYVILPLYTGYKKLFTRNLLYTAMTRAKKMLVIVGSKNIINYMVDNTDSKNRKTGLREKILEEI